MEGTTAAEEVEEIEEVEGVEGMIDEDGEEEGVGEQVSYQRLRASDDEDDI